MEYLPGSWPKELIYPQGGNRIARVSLVMRKLSPDIHVIEIERSKNPEIGIKTEPCFETAAI
jgi:hypothetical protein